ncbi:protein of unknown function [Pelagirhabdus alkalitolerans]|uniref:DUF4352 domain-containing protein n=1 Tax=Pelagirhabdus alkalitolerans TaxID=1612202 RepID=A0A1G6GNT8_9BACI|nr:DUF4352 domain-containing protein [Pelagirhabdus alkalitolerans]SDB83415.1 protein of unknown function [Pelagirhabdus alkalitolerans]
MKKILKWVAIAFVGLIVIGALLSDDDSETAETEATDQQETEEAEDEESSEEANDDSDDEVEEADESDDSDDVTVAGIGDAATIADVTFTVNEVNTTEEITSDNEFIDPVTTSGKFVLIDVTIDNDKQESITINSSFFTLHDENGTEYDPSTDGGIMMNLDDDDFFLEQINPGLDRTGTVVFEVGSDVDVSSSKLEAQTGFWGTERIEINLN